MKQGLLYVIGYAVPILQTTFGMCVGMVVITVMGIIVTFKENASTAKLCGGHGKCLNCAVIGGGFSGLVTSKELLNEGHKVHVFEQSSQLGGVWSEGESLRAVPGVTLSTSSVENTAIYDHYFDCEETEGLNRIFSSSKFLAYLRSYMKEFKIAERAKVSLSCKVTRVEQVNGKWEVEGVCV
jgi:cation diffusion facilitator CzcD-associated flavoprotein CzcO